MLMRDLAMYYLPANVLKHYEEKVPDKTLIRMYQLYVQEMTNLHFGQGYDIWWHNGKKNPSVDEYLQMCAFKTGTLARLSAKLAALVVGGTDTQVESIGLFAESIGVAFQIQDDIMNLVSENLTSTKGQVGEDIREGKRTLMVLHCLQNAPKDQADRLLELLALREKASQAQVDEAIEIMKRNGSIDYARQKAKELVREAWRQVAIALPSNAAKDKLQAFAGFLVDRDI